MATSRWLATIRRGIDVDAPGVAGAPSWDVEIPAREAALRIAFLHADTRAGAIARERAGTPERAYQPTP